MSCYFLKKKGRAESAIHSLFENEMFVRLEIIKYWFVQTFEMY